MPVAKTDVTQEPKPAVSDLVEIEVAPNQIVYGRDKDGNPGVRAEGGETLFVSKKDLEAQPHIGTAKHGADAPPKMAVTAPAVPPVAPPPAPPAPQPIPAAMPKAEVK